MTAMLFPALFLPELKFAYLRSFIARFALSSAQRGTLFACKLQSLLRSRTDTSANRAGGLSLATFGIAGNDLLTPRFHWRRKL